MTEENSSSVKCYVHPDDRIILNFVRTCIRGLEVIATLSINMQFLAVDDRIRYYLRQPGGDGGRLRQTLRGRARVGGRRLRLRRGRDGDAEGAAGQRGPQGLPVIRRRGCYQQVRTRGLPYITSALSGGEAPKKGDERNEVGLILYVTKGEEGVKNSP